MFQSIFDIHLVFRCASICFFLVECKMQNRAPYLHLRLLCGSLSKMSIQKKGPKILHSQTTSFLFFQITCYHEEPQRFWIHLWQKMGGWVPHCKTSRCQHWCTWTNGWAQWHLKSPMPKLLIAIEICWNPKLVNQKMTQKKLKIWENPWNTITVISGIVNSTPIRFVVSSSLGHICYQDTERRLWATWKHDLTHGRPWTAMRSWMLSPPDPKHQGQHLAARRSIFANHLGVCWFVDLRSIWILIKLDYSWYFGA